MSPLAWGAAVALGVVVIGWLVVSFLPPSPRRARIEWVAAMALYATLLCFFANLLTRAREAGSTLAVVAFGFLAAFFAAGLAVSAWKTFRQIRGEASAGPSATG